jgi:hypothetical protein
MRATLGFVGLMLAFLFGHSHRISAVLPENKLVIYPAPKGIPANRHYKVTVGGRNVHVYDVKVGAAASERRFKAVDDLLNSAQYFDMAAFAYFDFAGKASVKVSLQKVVKSVRILPTSAAIVAKISGNTIAFQVAKPQNLTIEINGEVINSLHLFANPLETDRPSPLDTNVIYFGPGVHHVSGMIVGDNKTVYIAGGAVVKTVVGASERYGVEPSGLRNYAPSFELRGKNIKFRGRGIIDGSESPVHARNLIMVHGQQIELNGVILVNSPGWTVPLRESEKVLVKNIKILGYRANSDGIDICNSREVVVDSCFIRTNDDLIVIKTWENQGIAKQITVKNCVLWNQLANALSLGAELREDVSDVLFYNCDIIHDYSRAWCLRIFHSDDAKVSNITFEKIRIEEGHQLISVWMGNDIASHNGQRGRVENIVFKAISANGGALNIDVVGANANSVINNVRFEDVWLHGQRLIRDQVKNNQFVKDITVVPQ